MFNGPVLKMFELNNSIVDTHAKFLINSLITHSSQENNNVLYRSE